MHRLCPPPPVRWAPPVTEHVPLQTESLCQNMARASGDANNMLPLSWGHKRKRSEISLWYGLLFQLSSKLWYGLLFQLSSIVSVKFLMFQLSSKLWNGLLFQLSSIVSVKFLLFQLSSKIFNPFPKSCPKKSKTRIATMKISKNWNTSLEL